MLWIVFVAVKESRRETPTFRNLEIVEEYGEGEEEAAERSHDDDAVRAQAADTMSLFRRQGRWSGWINLGLAVIAIGGIIIGAATVSDGTDQILSRYSIEGTVFGATVVTAVLTIEDLFLTVRPIRLGVPRSASATSSAASSSRSPASSGSSSSPAAASRSARASSSGTFRRSSS